MEKDLETIKEVDLTSRTGFEETKLPQSLIGVVVTGKTLIPPSMIDQTNFLADGWS
jgi:hypothetical protein